LEDEMRTSNDLFRQIAVVLTTVGTIIMNILANTLPLNGQNTGDISDRFPVLFVPAGYVFSIWGLIYIGLIAYTIFHSLPAQRENPRMRATGWLYVFSGIANVAWLFFWHYNIFAVTLVAMLSLLGLLISIYLRLGVGLKRVSSGEKWLAHLPFSVYLGWITVATIANTTDVVYLTGWNGQPLTPEILTVILLVAALALSAILLYTRRDVAYAMVIVWATIGIAVKQAGVPLVPPASIATAVIVALLAAASLLRPRPGSPRARAA
jgi:hypothetical protein